MKSLRSIFLILAGSVSACGHEPAAPVYRAVLRTDQTSYFVASGGPGNTTPRQLRVILQYTNQSGAPIYLERCSAGAPPSFGTQSIGSDGTALGSADQVAGACSGVAGLTVGPGAVRADTVFISAPDPLPAKIRFFYLASSCNGDGGVCLPFLPESDRVSAPVLVLAAPSAAPTVAR
jgi:hypothetical protein